MKKVLTYDNTETFLNEEAQETYHSQTGAVEEAFKKYVIPCKIKELALKGEIRIMDCFFGIGYNSAMAITSALEINPECKIEVIALEKDPEIIKKIQKVNPPIGFYENYKRLNLNNLMITKGNVTVKIFLGDIRETIKSLPEDYFDAVFYDPFSPKKNPEMWSVELFQEAYRVMKNTAILATYSCARMIRENMSAAGLFYDDGPIVGRRGPGTIATKWI